MRTLSTASVLARTLFFSSCLTLLLVNLAAADEKPEQYFHANVLMYHHVSNKTPPITSTKVQEFKQHLQLLEDEGFSVWPLDRIVNHLQKRRPLPDKTVAITFDDAYKSVYEEALPLLVAKNWPFTIFVSASTTNRNFPLNMTWEELRSAQEQGALIANHSYSHAHLIRKQEDESQEEWLVRVETEIDKNQQELTQKLGAKPPKIFAHPYGEYNQEILDMLRKKGYVAFGQQSGPASVYQGMLSLPRYSASYTSAHLDRLRTKLYALPFPIVRQEPTSTILDGTNLRPELKLVLAKGNYRLKQFRCYGPDAHLLNTKFKRLEDESLEITITSNKDLEVGRPRYNCTAPHKSQNRFFWFSQQWLLPNADGSWYDF